MQKIIFNNDSTKTVYDVTMSFQNKRIYIKFPESDETVDTALFADGFVEVNEHNSFVQADFSGMKYIYRDFGDGLRYILTDVEDDVYVEPPEIETPIEPSEPYVPTLDEVKKSKISELSRICNQSIINGVDVEIDGNIEHFSYKEEDQVNIKEIFDIVIQTNIPMYYHSDGESCKLYTVEQIVTIYCTASTNKMHHTTYFNQLKLYVETLETSEEVNAIEYGQELTGTYLDTYNNSMMQAKLLLETLLFKNNESNNETAE